MSRILLILMAAVLLVGLTTTMVAAQWSEPQNLGPNVNTSYNESGLFFYGEKLFFNSNMPGGFGGYDIYVSTDIGGIWDVPENVEYLNSESDERAPSIACVDGQPEVVFGSTRLGTFDLWISRNGSLCPETPIWEWMVPDVMPVSTPDYVETMPGITADGNTLYFGSNHPGGYGGFDIWVTYRNGDGWTEPVNLGPVVNSEYEERGPSPSNDGNALYFASNRAGDHTNTDIYVSSYVEGEWTEPVIVGSPPNTEYNETCPQPSGDTLYFRSDRPGGYGEGDLYMSTRIVSIPTLNEWGLIILGLLLLTAGTVAVVRRRKAAMARTN